MEDYPTIKLVVVFKEDFGGYTGYALQFPGIITGGGTKDECLKNLLKRLNQYLQHVNNENIALLSDEMKPYEINSYQLILKSNEN